MNALHAARKNYIELEASEKLKRALKKNTRLYSDIIYQPGDIVFYKRAKEKSGKIQQELPIKLDNNRVCSLCEFIVVILCNIMAFQCQGNACCIRLPSLSGTLTQFKA